MGRKRLDLIVATKNQGKLREIRRLLRDLPLRVYGLDQFKAVPDVEEDGKSFAENALKKARFYANLFGKMALADDSGLEVDALNGRPGIYSARYAGRGATDWENRKKLLEEMAGLPLSKRWARFVCVLAVATPDGKEAVAEGSCRGRIGLKEVGRGGFGYDPLFFLPRYGKTMAQLSLEEKNRVSHRGKALRKLRRLLKRLADGRGIGISGRIC
ncbi:MAG: XTP/dITP diphosphatase [Desulfobacterota bacterium]|nr:XTP/dITP diphosphatase [Thermodesulfobacteriota bacterium]